MNRKRNTKARGKRALRQNPSTKINNDNTSVIINLSRHKLCPPRLLVKLGFQQAFTIANPASGQASDYFYANGAFDIDPSVGNLTLDGFNQWMALYGVFRVTHFKAKITAVNREAFPVRIATGFFPATQTTFNPISWNNPHCIEHPALGPLTGMGRTQIVRNMDLAKLIGVAAYEGDLTQYYGTSAMNPSSLASFNIGINSFAVGDLLSNGVNIAIEMELVIELSYPIKIDQV